MSRSLLTDAGILGLSVVMIFLGATAEMPVVVLSGTIATVCSLAAIINSRTVESRRLDGALRIFGLGVPGLIALSFGVTGGPPFYPVLGVMLVAPAAAVAVRMWTTLNSDPLLGGGFLVAAALSVATDQLALAAVCAVYAVIALRNLVGGSNNSPQAES